MRRAAVPLLVGLAMVGCRRMPADPVVLDLTAPRVPASMPSTQPATRATSRPVAAARGPMEHRLVVISGDALQARGHFVRAAVATDRSPPAVTLRAEVNDYPLSGTWTSDTIESEFPFVELLPSWNASVPEATGTRFDVRVRDAANATWSPWLYAGYWGRVTGDRRVTKFDGGEMDVDTLMLSRPANAFEMRATLMDFHATPTASPGVWKVAAVYSRAVVEGETARGDRSERAGGPTTQGSTTRPARVDLAVPFRAQGDNPRSVSGSTCSPTSVSMVLAWAGADRPILENALAIWDDDYAMFGNWNRAVQYAASLGYDAQLERFSSMDDVRERLASGQPLIASIRFRRGEFPSNLQDATGGHLIVIRGYDEHGDLICNDPASRAKGNGIVYKADELAHAWFINAGGATYIIRKKE